MKIIPLAAFAVILLCQAANAETVRILCDDGQTLTYEGEDAGKLVIVAPFGTIALPATRKGKAYIASGEATVLMPDMAIIEACVAKEMDGEEPDPEMMEVNASICAVGKPPAETPVAVQVDVNALVHKSHIAVELGRTYAEAVAAGKNWLRISTGGICKAGQ
jgi:hypothetical protein